MMARASVPAAHTNLLRRIAFIITFWQKAQSLDQIQTTFLRIVDQTSKFTEFRWVLQKLASHTSLPVFYLGMRGIMGRVVSNTQHLSDAKDARDSTP